MDDTGSRLIRRRARRTDVTLAREAAYSVKPFREKLGEWQRSAALIRARIEHCRGQSDRDEALAAAEQLGEEFESVRAELQEKASQLSASVVRHSKFQDAIRALQSLEGVLASVHSTPYH